MATYTKFDKQIQKKRQCERAKKLLKIKAKEKEKLRIWEMQIINS